LRHCRAMLPATLAVILSLLERHVGRRRWLCRACAGRPSRRLGFFPPAFEQTSSSPCRLRQDHLVEREVGYRSTQPRVLSLEILQPLKMDQFKRGWGTLWALGSAPREHRSDSLSAAFHNLDKGA
jgi:hypothetical protein